LALLSQEVKV